MEIDERSLPRSQHLTILGYSLNPSFYLCYRTLHQPRPVFVMLFLLLLLSTVVVNLSITKPYHQAEESPYQKKNATDCGGSTDEHLDSNPRHPYCLLFQSHPTLQSVCHLTATFRIILDCFFKRVI